MKYLFLSLLSIYSMQLLAEDISLEKISKAQYCKAELSPGSSSKLNIDGESFLIDLINENSRNITTIQEIKLGKCQSVDVVGYRVFESGHFPNPMVPFQVFKILEIKKHRPVILGE